MASAQARHLRPDSEEAVERRPGRAEGDRGGKAADQGERPPATHATDTGRLTRVPGAGGRASSSQGRKQEKFTALLHHLTIDLLRESFYSIKRSAAVGVDQVTWKEYAQGVEDRLRDLHD